MKGTSVRILKITLHNSKGYYGVRWYHPAATLPPRHTNHSHEELTVHVAEILHGVVVSEPFVHEDNVCVVVQLQNDSRFESFETFWVGHLG